MLHNRHNLLDILVIASTALILIDIGINESPDDVTYPGADVDEIVFVPIAGASS